jgi:hypothetical protein
LGNLPLLWSEGFWSPADSSSGSGSSKACLCPLPDQVSLKLRECAKDMEDQLATTGDSINVLCQAFKPCPTLLKIGQQVLFGIH